MKARRVRGLDPAGTLADNAERIVRVRLDELASFAPEALEPDGMTALHDMRIAAKRLRYVLEVTADVCFGPYATTALARAKELQELLGEIHDCDVQLPHVHKRLVELRAADVRAARERTPPDAEDLDPAVAARTPHSRAWRGLETLIVLLEARRELLFDRFAALWARLEREGFRARLEAAAGERPPAAAAPVPDTPVRAA